MKISPSRLVYVEACPKFKPTPITTDAADEGIQFHKYMEELVQQPIDTWDSWIAGLSVSENSKALITTAMNRIYPFATLAPQCYPSEILPGSTLLTDEGLPPGMYPEVKVRVSDSKHNKFGYIDLLISLGYGNYVIIDYKFVRAGGDFELQMAAYACAISDAVPGINSIQAVIVAPYLADDAEPEAWDFGQQEIAEYKKVIEDICNKAENPNTDGKPGSHCERCAWSGQCRYQTALALTVTESPLAPDKQRLLYPVTLQDRADRRNLIKTLESMVDQIKEDDKRFFTEHPDAELPGYKMTRMQGRVSMDKTRASEINNALLSRFLGVIDINSLLSMSLPNISSVVEHLTLCAGLTTEDAKRQVNEALDEFMTRGAPIVTLRKVGAKTRVPKKLSN